MKVLKGLKTTRIKVGVYLKIKKNLTTQNQNAGTLSRIKYIVIHYTGNNGDTALANTNYFKSYRGASAHYFVDENSIYQSIEDKNIAWHCGANTYYHPVCRNHNSIGVELCSYKDSKGNFVFKDKTVENALWLVRELMAKYGIPGVNVVRHYDVTRKICPEPYVRDVKAWENFKARLIAKDVMEDEMIEKIKIKINGKEYNVDRILKDGKNFICLQDLAQAGFEIGYNKSTKVPSITNANEKLPLVVDDKETSVDAVNIKGNNYVPIRSLASAVGTLEVDYVDGKVIVKSLK